MNEIQLFSNPEFGEIRTLEINGEPWFVGKDIAEVLGYSNPQKAIRDHVDGEDRTVNESFTVNGTSPILINESGMYSLILSSKLPTAKQFKRWVTSEVLPAIRKTGSYSIKDSYMIDDPVQRAQRWIEEQQELRQHISALEYKAEEDKSKVIFADAVSASKTSILIGELAKLLKQNGVDTGQKRLFEWLRQNGFLIKGGSSKNMPTQRGMNMGLFEIKETSVTHSDGHITVNKTPKVTGKGQQYFINLLLTHAESISEDDE